ncbi:MAG TPA: sodium:solute symporter [Cyclobacteriaceae bacterium]|jgi:Na+/proline symporter
MEYLVLAGAGNIRLAGHNLLLNYQRVSMSSIDWIVLFGTLLAIVAYGAWKTRGSKTIEGYLKGDNRMKWWMIGISIMATQASAITFLSTPGQAIEDGMRFIQIYFGLPLAMVILSVTLVPIYYRLKVYTAYEYLEGRFDLKTRTLAAIYFLLLRGLSAGITLYAPAIVLATILNWSLYFTTVMIGMLVIIYVTTGGTKAVSLTQRYQMAVIMTGMLTAGFIAYSLIPDHVSFGDSVALAGELGKFNLVNLEFNLNDRYNIWSGLIGGTFLSLAYFGTDHSQVARYLGGVSLAESRMGLMFNGLLKIPMQFIILFIGVMVFVFFQFYKPPVYFNQNLIERARDISPEAIAELEASYDTLYDAKTTVVENLVRAIQRDDAEAVSAVKSGYFEIAEKERTIRDSVKAVISNVIPGAKVQDRDFIFLNFVIHNLPRGLVGLLIAVMFSAAMSSMASELNALASATTVDIYKRSFQKEASPGHYVLASRLFTVMWALLAMLFAILASFEENLIQFVNIVGSLFYGTLLGIFVTAFYLKWVRGTAVFFAALIAEVLVFYCHYFTNIAFLWYIFVGCFAVIIGSILIQAFLRKD